MSFVDDVMTDHNKEIIHKMSAVEYNTLQKCIEFDKVATQSKMSFSHYALLSFHYIEAVGYKQTGEHKFESCEITPEITETFRKVCDGERITASGSFVYNCYFDMPKLEDSLPTIELAKVYKSIGLLLPMYVGPLRRQKVKSYTDAVLIASDLYRKLEKDISFISPKEYVRDNIHARLMVGLVDHDNDAIQQCLIELGDNPGKGVEKFLVKMKLRDKKSFFQR